MSQQFEVDPAILNNVYRDKLAMANDENILLTAALTQMQRKIEELEATNKLQQMELDKTAEHADHRPEPQDHLPKKK